MRRESEEMKYKVNGVEEKVTKWIKIVWRILGICVFPLSSILRKFFCEWNVQRKGVDVNDAATVDDMYNNFSVKLCNAYNDGYPCIEKRRRKIEFLKPYINADLRSLIREKRRIQRLYRRLPYTYCTQ